MLKSKACKIIVGVGVAVQMLIGTLYHFGVVSNLWAWMLLTAAIVAIIYVLANTKVETLHAVVYALLFFTMFIGAGRLTVSTCSSTAYAYTCVQNYISVKQIENGCEDENKTHIHLFDYDGYQYYTDIGYTYLYKINRSGLSVDVAANNIFIEADFKQGFSGDYTEFYSANNNDYFVDHSDDSISFAFMENFADDSVLVKIVSQSNKVFYSYIDVEQPIDFLNALNIVADSIKIGGTSIVLTQPTILSDRTGTIDEEEFGGRYLITANDTFWASPITTVTFTDNMLYNERINWYINRDALALLDGYKEELKDLDAETDEAKTLSAQISLLEAAIGSYQVELVYENTVSNGEVRLYRVKDYSSSLTETPEISIIEIKIDGIYTYGLTDLEIEDLF